MATLTAISTNVWSRFVASNCASHPGVACEAVPVWHGRFTLQSPLADGQSNGLKWNSYKAMCNHQLLSVSSGCQVSWMRCAAKGPEHSRRRVAGSGGGDCSMGQAGIHPRLSVPLATVTSWLLLALDTLPRPARERVKQGASPSARSRGSPPEQTVARSCPQLAAASCLAPPGCAAAAAAASCATDGPAAQQGRKEAGGAGAYGTS